MRLSFSEMNSRHKLSTNRAEKAAILIISIAYFSEPRYIHRQQAVTYTLVGNVKDNRARGASPFIVLGNISVA